MYSLLVALQIIAILLSFICVATLIMQKNSDAAKLMLVVCLCSLIQNAGYYFEMRSTSLAEALIALKLEYVGGGFVATMLMIFVFRYCRVKLIEWIKNALILIDLSVVVCVWCCDFIHIYYKGIEYVNAGVMPHLLITKGFYYVFFSIIIYGELVISAVVSLMSAIRTEDSNTKKNYILLFLSCVIPCLFYICGIVNLIDGYDPTPLGVAVGIMIFAFAIIVRRVFDVVETAHENILMELEDAIVILDYRRGFQEANKAAVALFPELASTQFGQLVPSAAFNELLDKKNEEVEIGGRYYKVHVNELFARSGINSKFIGYSIVLFDITESKNQLVKMTELKKQADSANQAKSSFLANVSHEIRTPINVVVGMSDVILRDYDDKQLLGYAQNIQTAANTLLDLINDILDFSKIEAGRITLNNDNFGTTDLFRDIILVFKHKGDEKGLYFDTYIDSNIPRVLYGDVIRLKQIITNILTNAFKYTNKGGVTLRAAFDRFGDARGKLVLSIEDTGIGIKKDELSKIFEMFVRLDERLNRSVEGTGLGLNITKKLVDVMSGDIKVYSEYGKGSVFTVTIPLSVVSKDNDNIGDIQVNEVVTKRAKIGCEAPDAKVLIIDDAKTNLIVAKALLRDTKVKITTGSSGEECLKLVQNERFDVIFLDHRMPGMDGIETLKQMNLIKHKCDGVPVIMLTANAVSSAKEFYVKEGFNDFISKPISEESITTMLFKYLPKELVKTID